MKKLVSLILISLLLVVGLTSFAINTSQQSALDTSAGTLSSDILSSPITQASTAGSSTSTLNDTQSPQKPFLAYKDVLQNKTEFSTTSYAENGTKTIYLDQLLNDDTFKFLNFAVLDMDGDKTPEIVIQYCLTGDYPYPDYVEVLHYSDGIVYGYNFSYRGLYCLKNDGTFNWSNGADDNGYSKLRFTSNNCEYDDIGYCKSNLPTGSYFIDNQTVTESEYQAFIKNQDNKKDAIWYDFNKKNIDNLDTNFAYII